jgi:hypothetical protein
MWPAISDAIANNNAGNESFYLLLMFCCVIIFVCFVAALAIAHNARRCLNVLLRTFARGADIDVESGKYIKRERESCIDHHNNNNRSSGVVGMSATDSSSGAQRDATDRFVVVVDRCNAVVASQRSGIGCVCVGVDTCMLLLLLLLCVVCMSRITIGFESTTVERASHTIVDDSDAASSSADRFGSSLVG